MPTYTKFSEKSVYVVENFFSNLPHVAYRGTLLREAFLMYDKWSKLADAGMFDLQSVRLYRNGVAIKETIPLYMELTRENLLTILSRDELSDIMENWYHNPLQYSLSRGILYQGLETKNEEENNE